MAYTISCDIGGTFTDFTVASGDGTVTTWKESSSPTAPLEPIKEGLRNVAAQMGTSLQDMLAETESFVHGSTIATNTLIQRNGGPAGLLATAGFRDIIYFRDGYKPERFNVHLSHPGALIDRHLRIGVRERVDPQGNVVTPLAEEDVAAAAETFRAAGVKAIAVAFLWSVMNPENERRAAAILRERCPGIDVVCSNDVLQEIREWERTSATVLSAYVLPRIGTYLTDLETFLAENGYRRSAQIMQCNGGCAAVREVVRRPVVTLASGPAAAPAAALYHAEDPDSADMIAVDMGGTSFDVCLIRGGQPAMSRNVQVEDQPIGVQAVEVHSIGAGGGSIGWIDAGGALRVGPQSAGATPGPACYGAGGEQPTVTDANVVLGYLAPEKFLGGRRQLRGDLAEKAVEEHVARPSGISTVEGAAGMIELVNSNMVGGIRAVSVERGIDPRSFVLVSGGGAGGMHAASLARRLQMKRLVIPAHASTFCAFGMSVSDVRHEYTHSKYGVSTEFDLEAVSKPFAEMEKTARERLREEGFSDDRIVVRRSVDARYQGQVHELTITIPTAETYGEEHLREIEASFHQAHGRAHVPHMSPELKLLAEAFDEAHEQQFTYSLPEAPLEFLHWRLTAVGLSGDSGVRPRADIAAADRKAAEPSGERPAYFGELGGIVPVPTYDRDTFVEGATVAGPAIVEGASTTVVLNPGDSMVVDRTGTLYIDVAADQAVDERDAVSSAG